MKKIVLILTLALLCASLSGCMNTTDTPAPTATPGAVSSPTVTATPGPTDAAKAAAPAQLGELKAAAEGIMNDANSGDWAAAQTKMDTIKKDMGELTTALQQAGVSAQMTEELNTPIASLEQQIAAKSAYEAKVQANQITKVLPDIYDNFETSAPTDLGRMGYYAREIVLNAEKADWTNAGINAGELKNVWARLQPNLSAAQKDGIDMSAEVDALNADVTGQDAAACAKDSLALQQKIIAAEGT